MLSRGRWYHNCNLLTCTKDVTIAGINVKDQEIALVDRSYWWTGDGTISGLIGLAYSTLTSAYIGTNGALDPRDSTWGSDSLLPNRYQHDHARTEFPLVQSKSD